MKMEHLTRCEQLVMKAVWDAETELGLMDIVDIVNRRFQKEWKPQTVSTFLARLTRKGYLNCYRQGRIFYYQILISQEDYKAKMADEFLNFWNHDNADEFIHSIMQVRPLRSDEIDRINRFITQTGVAESV